MDGDDKRLSENHLSWRKAVRTTKLSRRFIVDEMTKDLDYFKESKIMANNIRGPNTADEYWNSSELLGVMGGEATLLCAQRDDLDDSPKNATNKGNATQISDSEPVR
jgi:hypothetical protein